MTRGRSRPRWWAPTPHRDLALVSFTSKDTLPVADLGDSGQLEVGDLVLAVGNPFGFENTVTMGIVSALGRSGPSRSDVATNTDYIQTDAAINQGNSGGALVNIRGEVIGINTWIAAPTGGSIGLGFAIPINNAKKAIDDFITKGKVEYGFLGVIRGRADQRPHDRLLRRGQGHEDRKRQGRARGQRVQRTRRRTTRECFRGTMSPR